VNFSFLHQLVHLRQDSSTGVRYHPASEIDTVDAINTQAVEGTLRIRAAWIRVSARGVALPWDSCHPRSGAFRENKRPLGRRQIMQQNRPTTCSEWPSPKLRCIDPVDARSMAGAWWDGLGIVLRSPSKGPPSAADCPGSKSKCCDIEPAGAQRR